MTSWERLQSGTASEYASFLAEQHDSVPFGDFVLLYGLSDIAERNSTHEIASYLNGWIAIGDDGSGSAVLMKLDGSPGVFRCSLGAIGSADPDSVADSFAAWLADDCPATWLIDYDDDDYDDD